MKYKAVVSDLDGTLLNSKSSISAESIRVIKKLIEKGIKFFVATGRHHMDVKYILDKNGLNTGIITSNGAVVLDMNDKEIIKHTIEENFVKELFKSIDFGNAYVNIYSDDTWYINKEWEEARLYTIETGFTYSIIDLKKFESKDVIKIFAVSEDHDFLVELEKRILNKFSKKLAVVFSSPYCLEIMAHGVNKAVALEEVLKMHNIDLEETIAFGDGFNDYEMLKKVGKGFVMTNAHYKLKDALRDNPRAETNDENGAALKIQEIFDIE
jgi:hypothetical protein